MSRQGEIYQITDVIQTTLMSQAFFAKQLVVVLQQKL